VPITTPAYSPESNGLAEGFVHTFKRDYVNVHELRDAETVLAPARRLVRMTTTARRPIRPRVGATRYAGDTREPA
jgi:hypothetical protein